MSVINPYNFNNKLLTIDYIGKVLNTFQIYDEPKNVDIYQRAFIHSSYKYNKELIEETGIVEKPEGALTLFSQDYERLEFLGDSILGSIIAHYLYERYENENEGFLSVMKTKLVRKHALAYLSRELGFNRYIIMSRHMEDVNNGRNNIDILEDVFEAFIGAIYLDFGESGYTVAQNFLINLIEEKVDFAELIVNDTNYKGQVTKYYMKTHQQKITFKIMEKGGNIVKVGVYDKDDALLGVGIGNNKKTADQNACKELLIKLDLLN